MSVTPERHKEWMAHAREVLRRAAQRAQAQEQSREWGGIPAAATYDTTEDMEDGDL